MELKNTLPICKAVNKKNIDPDSLPGLFYYGKLTILLLTIFWHDGPWDQQNDTKHTSILMCLAYEKAFDNNEVDG